MKKKQRFCQPDFALLRFYTIFANCIKYQRMESFFRTHAYLVEHTHAPVRRALMDEIDWNDRLIGIKGTRGVGKTTFLLQYAKEHFHVEDRKCLYINLNNFYFQGKGIAEFATEFYEGGGKVLLIDQVFKQPDWSTDLRKCYGMNSAEQRANNLSGTHAAEDGEPGTERTGEIIQPERIFFPRVSQLADGQ